MRESIQNSDAKRSASNRGFASMDEEKQRQIASKGGKAAHERGTAHQFTSAEAAAAGRKGGLMSGSSRAARARNSGMEADLQQSEKPLPRQLFNSETGISR